MRGLTIALILLVAGTVGLLLFHPPLPEPSCVRLGRDLVVPGEASCSGDSVVIGGNLLVEGRVGRNAVAIGGSVRVKGQVLGAVISIGGEVWEDAGAQIGGDVTVLGGRFYQATGALIQGSWLDTRFSLPEFSRPIGPLASWWIRFGAGVLTSGLVFGACLLFALALRSLWPRRTQAMVETLRQQWAASLGLGAVSLLLAAVLVPILAIILAILLLGIPLIPFLLLLSVLLYMAGLTITGLAVGETLVARAGRKNPPAWLPAALGMAIVAPLAILPGFLIPYLGLLWTALAPSAGIGALALSRAGTLSRTGP